MANHSFFSALAFLLFLLPMVHAGTSSIVLELVDADNDGIEELVATSVFDDDASIEQVDVFVAGEGSVERHPFTGVREGKAFSVPFSPLDTVSYNFNDTDGADKGLGTMIIVQAGSANAPVCDDCEREQTPAIILSQKFLPRMAEGNSAYYIDFRTLLNAEFGHSDPEISYSINGGAQQSDKVPVFDGTHWIVTFGPFNQRINLVVRTSVVDGSGTTHASIKQAYFELLLPLGGEQACNIGQVVSVSGDDSLYPGLESPGIRFASLDGFSYLSVSKASSGELTATRVIDDDSSIGRVDVFYQSGENVTQTTFQNVARGDSLGSIPASADYSWFNYFDSDGSVSNISVLNQFESDEAVILPTPEESEQPDYVTCINLVAVASPNGRSFEVFAELCKGSDTPDEIGFVYRVDNGSWRSDVQLSDSGDVWRGSLGTFDGAVTLDGFYEASGSAGFASSGIYPNWFSQVLGEQLECRELCYDNEDNDLDGLIDEGCVLLPELFFLKKNIPFYGLSEQPLGGSVTVKNSGIVNSTSFAVDFYLGDIKISSGVVPGLDAGESSVVSFSVPYRSSFEGEHIFRVVIDPENSVPELIESNNVYEQSIVIGPNFFDMKLNFNSTPFPGDFREIEVRDAYERPVEGAIVTVTTPGGNVRSLTSDSSGLVRFQLPEAGAYSVLASKENFIPFEGRFAISNLVLVGLNDTVPLGSSQSFTVQNEEGMLLPDGLVQVSSPTGTTLSFELSEESRVSFSAVQQGRYALRIVRNEVVVYESDFLATGIIESLLVGPGGLLDLVFGPIIRTPVLFVLLMLLSLGAAYFAYNKASLFFRRGAKGTTEKRIENSIKIGIALVYFVVPFQFDRFFGFNVGLLAVFLEVVLLIIYEYYLRSIKGVRKAIKV